MKLSCEKKNSANGKIEVKVSKDILDAKAKKIAANIAKNVKVDGFRKGKVPANVVEKRYGEKIQEDARQEVITEALNNGLKELGVEQKDLVGQPLVTRFEEKEGGIEAEISFSMRPEIAFDKIEELIPDFKEVEVEERELLERIENMAKAMAPLESYEGNRMCKKGDFLTIDFVGTIDGVEFAGGKADDMVIELGGGRFLPDFEKNLENMKIGDEKEFELVFPEDYGNKELAGKTAVFKVKLKGIQVKPEITIDEELAKKMMPEDPEATLEKLKTIIEEQLKSEKTTKLFTDELKPQLIEALVGKYNFDLPDMIVEQEMDLMFRGKVGAMSEEELMALKDAEDKVKAMREEMRAEAEKSVKATFLIDELARKEGITVNDNELVQAIFYEAMGMGAEPKAMLEYYQKQGLLPAIKMAMIEDKLLTHLLNKKKADK
ncbi:MAG: trigger factor [Campylobacteraceae bacterium]|jgi:trigger factor|nr:trigger factor [Campylobacteraceae bacterium]